MAEPLIAGHESRKDAGALEGLGAVQQGTTVSLGRDAVGIEKLDQFDDAPTITGRGIALSNLDSSCPQALSQVAERALVAHLPPDQIEVVRSIAGDHEAVLVVVHAREHAAVGFGWKDFEPQDGRSETAPSIKTADTES